MTDRALWIAALVSGAALIIGLVIGLAIDHSKAPPNNSTPVTQTQPQCNWHNNGSRGLPSIICQ